MIRAPGSTSRGATPRIAEAVVTAVAGASLGALTALPFGLAPPVSIPFAAIGGLNGAISGWRGTYQWRSVGGVVGFVLDSSWALGTTAAALFAHVAGRIRGDPQYHEGLSLRQNRHVYARGFQPRKGFATTLGNVVSGAGDLTRARRQQLVTNHEEVHVWQARWFGPLYPVLYVGWAAGAVPIGAMVWATRRRSERLAKVVESCAYYVNPFEWWAYSRDDRWPPKGLVPGLGWRRPFVKPCAPAASGGEPAVDVGEEVGGGEAGAIGSGGGEVEPHVDAAGSAPA